MASESEQEAKVDFEGRGDDNPMKQPYLEKLVLNIGVGTGGEELERAVAILKDISGAEPIKTVSKTNAKDFNLRKGRPIGTKVTIRGEQAEKVLKNLLIVNNKRMLRRSFDDYGNFGFGIEEHISIPGIEYDNRLGIWGLDVCGRIVRPGMRVKYRRVRSAKIPRDHYVSREESQFFMKKKFGVDIVDKLELDYF